MVLRKKEKKKALCDGDWTATLARRLRRECDKEPAKAVDRCRDPQSGTSLV